MRCSIPIGKRGSDKCFDIPPPDPDWLDAQNVEKRSGFPFRSERDGLIESTGRGTGQMVLLFVVAVGMICLLFLFVVSHMQRIAALCYGG